MALPNVGGGQQLTDGNLNELVIGAMPTPNTALTSSATLTVGQLTSQWLVANPSTSAASYTLPTVAVLETTPSPLNNAKPGSTFDLVIINLGTSSGALTIVTAAGWTLVGSVTVAITSSATFRALKTAGGAGITSTWSLYRIA